ncbi:nuclear transport factor 2 family protein [Brevundimonas viscosa]|uniref:SnoaL-like domain-containing protein n=1 Tax=Brevundimonas viscosa TaxID=871741 RepID=A0A1I6Q1C2_9CAUL|nr:nuclear transport factor 2 family protein [Brevundimonas viscosa]SFS46214.1 SnoaL-like domain-containing protein [Brevundimonas viscosa]
MLAPLLALALSVQAPDPAVAEAAAVLDELHAAAARADVTAWADRLAPGLVWVGNETSERWNRDAFLDFAAPVFARDEGWTYVARERHVTLAPDPCACVAWFDEVLDSATYGTARGEGLLVRDGGRWRVLRYALSYPIPNDLARDMTAEIRAFEAAAPVVDAPGEAADTPEEEAAAVTLDALHAAAAAADSAVYFDLFAPDAVYIGTDVTERWTIDQFRAYAEPYFARGRGWTYTPRSRALTLAPLDCRCVVWFDEVLDSESYGTSRGTGVLVRGDDGRWRVALYALTFPIPNALARDMTARIRAAAQ